MTMELAMLAWSAALALIMNVTASTIRTKMYTVKGVVLSVGNRDDLPPPSELFGRADRAAKNMTENLVLFAAMVLVTYGSGKANEITALGAQLFFGARLIYFPLYLKGVKWIRTGVWGISIGGMALMGSQLF